MSRGDKPGGNFTREHRTVSLSSVIGHVRCYLRKYDGLL